MMAKAAPHPHSHPTEIIQKQKLLMIFYPFISRSSSFASKLCSFFSSAASYKTCLHMHPISVLFKSKIFHLFRSHPSLARYFSQSNPERQRQMLSWGGGEASKTFLEVLHLHWCSYATIQSFKDFLYHIFWGLQAFGKATWKNYSKINYPR